VEVLGTYRIEGRGLVVVIRRSEFPGEVRQGDVVEGTNGRRWSIMGIERGTAAIGKTYDYPIIGLLLKGKGEPKTGKQLIVVDNGEGDAIWISAEQARAILHVLRTTKIWRQYEHCNAACEKAPPGLDKLATHERHLESCVGYEQLMKRLRRVGFGERGKGS
jgi:hypothetical protein